MSVIIGVDLHKASHTAVAIGGDECQVAKVTVRATCQQTANLLAWAEPFAHRTWAIESAGGLGYLLAQQLVDAGEVVLDVPPTLAWRVRVLGTGRSEKNDPNDAFSVAIAALRAKGLHTVERAEHTQIMRLLAKRNHDLGRLRARLVHQTMKKYLCAQEGIETKKQLQRALDRFASYYNDVRPHREIGRRTPMSLYIAREKAGPSPSFVKVGDRRLRLDKVDTRGRVTLRHRGRLHHIGIGNPYARWRVAMLIDGLDIEIVGLDGSPLRRLMLDPTKDYQRIP